MSTPPPSKPEHLRRDRPRPELTLEDVWRPLVEGLNGIAVESAPVVLPVRCGLSIGAHGKRQRCGSLIGAVVATPPGLAWRPAAPEPDRVAPGYVAMLLPVSPVESRRWFCETFGSTCTAGHSWTLGVPEVLKRVRRAKNARKPYYVMRAIPDDFGPMVRDPKYWTPEDLIGAVRGLVALAAGEWPPPGLTGVQAAQLSNRVDTLVDVLNGTGPYADRLPMVQAAMKELVAIPDDSTPP